MSIIVQDASVLSDKNIKFAAGQWVEEIRAATIKNIGGFNDFIVKTGIPANEKAQKKFVQRMDRILAANIACKYVEFGNRGRFFLQFYSINVFKDRDIISLICNEVKSGTNRQASPSTAKKIIAHMMFHAVERLIKRCSLETSEEVNEIFRLAANQIVSVAIFARQIIKKQNEDTWLIPFRSPKNKKIFFLVACASSDPDFAYALVIKTVLSENELALDNQELAKKRYAAGERFLKLFEENPCPKALVSKKTELINAMQGIRNI